MSGEARSDRTGVILLNLGGPDSPESVRPFLYNLFSDRLIIKLGPPFMQKPIAWFIAKRRAPKSMVYYNLIGGKSPLLEITTAQADALEARLKPHADFKCYVGMRYWKPFMADTAKRMRADGITRLVSLSLYPHYSIATTGSSETALREALAGSGMEVEFVSQWFAHEKYIAALCDLISKPLPSKDTLVIFSAHSLPQSFIDDGDPYVDHIMGSIRAIEKRLGIRWKLGYQSRSGPVKWLTPPTEEVIAEAAGSGEKEALIVPISFVSDHIETLYEIDILYKGLAMERGMKLTRTASLNTHPLFIEALEDLVMTAARSRSWA